jgi:aspartyl-tRNA(Asn)/glutamyl-tRNA(Gln) amidotransferase subunit A
VPIAHKDVFVTRGWKSTAGSKMLANYESPFDATVVERLAAAGMVTLGKTNMDEFAMGSSNENSFFGPVSNPWDTSRVPGGSSGGSAAAVAGLAPAATGTDTGGSIRQPASFSGITGIKPTYGRVSRYGMIAFASSLDQGGPMAHSAEDCALLLNGMAGFDPKDSTSLPEQGGVTRTSRACWASRAPAPPPASRWPACASACRASISARALGRRGTGRARRAGRVREAGRHAGRRDAAEDRAVDPGVLRHRAGRGLVEPVALRWRALRPSRREYRDLLDMYKKSRAEGFGPEVKRRIMVGTYVLSHGYYDAYYLQAQKIRRIIADDFQRAFTQCDVIMGPVAPTVAWKLGEKTADPVQMYLADIFTLSTSLAGLPGMSVPAASAKASAVGLQLIGNYFDEARLLQTAHAFQQATDWHLRRRPDNAMQTRPLPIVTRAAAAWPWRRRWPAAFRCVGGRPRRSPRATSTSSAIAAAPRKMASARTRSCAWRTTPCSSCSGSCGWASAARAASTWPISARSRKRRISNCAPTTAAPAS